MNEELEYISDEKLDRLDNFLLERIGDDADTEGKDEGIFCLSQLDGFLAAVVSGPTMITPSQWLPAVWGDFEPVWDSEKEFQEIFMLIVDIMNSNATLLMDSTDEYEPLFLEHEVKGKTYTIVDEWCEGYIRGVNLARNQWDTGGLEMQILLTPIAAFTSETKWQAHELTSDVELATVRNAITPNVHEIYDFWQARREVIEPVVSTVRHDTSRIGRNDPCPCGSGKKYKKCCLH